MFGTWLSSSISLPKIFSSNNISIYSVRLSLGGKGGVMSSLWGISCDMNILNSPKDSRYYT